MQLPEKYKENFDVSNIYKLLFVIMYNMHYNNQDLYTYWLFKIFKVFFVRYSKTRDFSKLYWQSVP
jgi:hypothetical protein